MGSGIQTSNQTPDPSRNPEKDDQKSITNNQPLIDKSQLTVPAKDESKK
jgi:hypothetical protein